MLMLKKPVMVFQTKNLFFALSPFLWIQTYLNRGYEHQQLPKMARTATVRGNSDLDMDDSTR